MRSRHYLYAGIYCLIVAAIGLFAIVMLASAAEVTLQWDPPTEGTPTGYKIYQGLKSGEHDKIIDAGLRRELTIQGLLPGTTYYWRATAYNAEAESDFSNEVSKYIPAVPVLSAPVVTTAFNGTAVTFTFDTGNVVPTRYFVRIVEAPTKLDGPVGTMYEGTSNSITVSDLTPGKTYNFYGRYNVDAAVSIKGASQTITIPTVIILKAPQTLIIKAE